MIPMTRNPRKVKMWTTKKCTKILPIEYVIWNITGNFNWKIYPKLSSQWNRCVTNMWMKFRKSVGNPNVNKREYCKENVYFFEWKNITRCCKWYGTWNTWNWNAKVLWRHVNIIGKNIVLFLESNDFQWTQHLFMGAQRTKFVVCVRSSLTFAKIHNFC